eukprot:998501-Amphidinium_carterae.1
MRYRVDSPVKSSVFAHAGIKVIIMTHRVKKTSLRRRIGISCCADPKTNLLLEAYSEEHPVNSTIPPFAITGR